ncbi:UDP-N-acetylmuramoyl-L-alanyl-D-glutamate--2,6-diaminopimelate ligase [Bifidobacterium platyrrhinorum]|uniref:UDP-N-acetylmuramoyl-L-alanyl-D-glutamate--2, 6-diaminopimelate ligase n=1 Tax=Bifidobacterium platyrrhinorum TaxID=2661628 RepID=A0A6L9SQF9_9BIFI|nr:UDP-N-acetylmuramoyl-L-alanyl-D-glutamate--2,6-diaminopimelate ligase [Bifidobacterium platyrrhinorum]NEG54415.1 UDP-N-acetylmuramoyl-L-alanyl-D-glutamate--2,6-diaminopimelate ligase [Bifidobacterium platyrrhinorum]
MPTTTSPLSLASAAKLLEDHHLLREIIAGDVWTMDATALPGADAPIPAITYDTRQVREGTLLFVKGRFKPEFLDGIDGRGLGAYVAETPYADRTKAPGLIVEDVHKAMSLLSAEFFGRPQDSLTMVGITGTKGKTTTDYFTHAILNAYSHGHAAMMSSIAVCLDGRTWTPSALTTPESLDAFRMMREAVDNGMEYMVMEVSSQAYKVNRVYGLTFDVGAFLNISPDHISPIEHPTFEDYFRCKRRIVANSRRLVLGADCDHADLLLQDAKAAGTPVGTFALHDPESGHTTPADVTVAPDPSSKTGIRVSCDGETRDFTLDMLGEFNFLNADAAIAIAHAAGVPFGDPAMGAVERVQVPGRMERFVGADGLHVYVDFAHNYMSTKALVDEMMRVYGEKAPRITVVAGSTGGKAIDRRKGIVDGALGRAESFILTTDDPNFEDPHAIAEEMASYVTDPKAEAKVVVDRVQAIATAIGEARESIARDGRFNIVLVIGKGHETRNIIDGKAVAWPGDAAVVRRELGLG